MLQKTIMGMQASLSKWMLGILILLLILNLGCDHSGSVVQQENTYPIYAGRLAPGLGLGVNTSAGLTNWIFEGNGVIEMAYPSGQSWGAVFITVGEPINPPRPSIDLSRFKRISIKLRGKKGGESVWIGLKDADDPDDGREIQVRIFNLSVHWETYELPLSQFYSADLKKIYVPIEFIYGGGGAITVYFQDIQYIP